MDMVSSQIVLRNLKRLSVAGLLLNALAFVVIFVATLMNPALLGSMRLWIAFFVTFSVGMPMYGLLYASMKHREYLRDILAATLQQK